MTGAVRCHSAVAILLPMVAGFFVFACTRPESPRAAEAAAIASGKIVAVFVDRSQSTAAETGLYQQGLNRVLAALQPGDRLIASAISEKSSQDFTASIDRELPPPFRTRVFTDPELVYKKQAAQYQDKIDKARTEVQNAVASFLKSPPDSKHTAILETMMIAEQIFSSTTRRRVLVILSDMLEDSAIADFEKAQIDDRYTTSLLARLQSASLIPNLSNVDIFVAGAQAATPQRAAAVQHFWQAYFVKAGAPLKPGHYARALMTFE